MTQRCLARPSRLQASLLRTSCPSPNPFNAPKQRAIQSDRTGARRPLPGTGAGPCCIRTRNPHCTRPAASTRAVAGISPVLATRREWPCQRDRPGTRIFLDCFHPEPPAATPDADRQPEMCLQLMASASPPQQGAPVVVDSGTTWSAGYGVVRKVRAVLRTSVLRTHLYE